MLNHELNRNKRSSITKDRNEDYRMNVSKFDDSYRHLLLLGALDEIAQREEDEACCEPRCFRPSVVWNTW